MTVDQAHGPWCRPENCDIEKSWEPHYLHGLRPWRTCPLCFRMSWFTFITLPLLQRWWTVKFRILAVIMPFGYDAQSNSFRRRWWWEP